MLLFVFLGSCNKDIKDRKVNFIEIKYSIESEKIEIQEVFQPIDMLILDDYILFQNQYMDKGDCFFVYSSKNYEFLYSFGKKGIGPEEFISPKFIDNSFGNTLSLVDNGKLVLKDYDLNTKNAILKKESKINELRFPIQDMSFIDDSLSFILYYTNEDVFLYSYNYLNNKVIDTLSFDTGLKELIDGEFNSALNDFNFCNRGRKFVVNFLFLNKLISGEVDECGKFINKKYPHLKSDFIPSKTLYDNINYYNYPQMSNNFIYAQYYGYNFRNLAPPPFNLKGRNYNYLMEVYNLDLQPIALLDFDHESYRFYINKEGDKMFFWDPLKDFDNLLIFNVPDFNNL